MKTQKLFTAIIFLFLVNLIYGQETPIIKPVLNEMVGSQGTIDENKVSKLAKMKSALKSKASASFSASLRTIFIEDGEPVRETNYQPSVRLGTMENDEDGNKGAITFATNQYLLDDKAKEVLTKFASFILEYGDGMQILIAGHTDNVGSENYNYSLSDKRALSVKTFFISCGIKPSIITIKGYGEDNPRVSNESAIGRGMNRRVEFNFFE